MLGLFSKYIFLGATQQRLFRRGPAILMYHRIGQPPPHVPDPFLYETADGLDRHLMQASSAGLRLGSLDDALAGGRLQPRSLAVTFDDGCRDTLEGALPVLKKHKVAAIQFIVAGRIGGRNDWDLSKDDVPTPLMDVGQIREWLAEGQQIGSHSMTHRNLRTLPYDQAREEIFASKKRLEDLFGVPVRHFAFPYGGWRKGEVRQLVREAGYNCALTTEFGVSQSSAEMVREAGYDSACTTDFGITQDSSELWNLRRITPMSELQLLRKTWHRIIRKTRG
jgi:peptidoglycan/xylan/chitin deacetylase (PgdA/CDA1 family)